MNFSVLRSLGLSLLCVVAPLSLPLPGGEASAQIILKQTRTDYGPRYTRSDIERMRESDRLIERRTRERREAQRRAAEQHRRSRELQRRLIAGEKIAPSGPARGRPNTSVSR